MIPRKTPEPCGSGVLVVEMGGISPLMRLTCDEEQVFYSRAIPVQQGSSPDAGH